MVESAEFLSIHVILPILLSVMAARVFGVRHALASVENGTEPSDPANSRITAADEGIRSRIFRRPLLSSMMIMLVFPLMFLLHQLLVGPGIDEVGFIIFVCL